MNAATVGANFTTASTGVPSTAPKAVRSASARGMNGRREARASLIR
jgi:hypothetical protein